MKKILSLVFVLAVVWFVWWLLMGRAAEAPVREAANAPDKAAAAEQAYQQAGGVDQSIIVIE